MVVSVLIKERNLPISKVPLQHIWHYFKTTKRLKKEFFMKQISLFIISILTALSVYAQQTRSAVTITVNGNKNLQIAIDERDYNLTNSNTIGNKTTITIN